MKVIILKKTGIYILMVLLVTQFAYAALSNPSPQDGATIKQSNSTFSIVNSINNPVGVFFYNNTALTQLAKTDTLTCTGSSPYMCKKDLTFNTINNGQRLYYFYFEGGIRNPTAGYYNVKIDGDNPTVTINVL